VRVENALFGRKNSGFRIEQGICRNALELPSESTEALPKSGRKWPEFEEFPVVFPVGREKEHAPIGQHPAFSGSLSASMILRKLSSEVAIAAIGVGVVAG
jgi:hypothetical protein